VGNSTFRGRCIGLVVSLELLSHLARSLRADPVLLLGTYRDVEVGRQYPLETTINTLTRDRVVEVLTLRGLPPEGTAELICARFGVTEVSDSLRDLVHERTEGRRHCRAHRP
jgi:hypothetical protein